VVLDAELISEILALPTKDQQNVKVVRNMLMLIQLMILNKNEKALD
jgi:hypothetical protein